MFLVGNIATGKKCFVLVWLYLFLRAKKPAQLRIINWHREDEEYIFRIYCLEKDINVFEEKIKLVNLFMRHGVGCGVERKPRPRFDQSCQNCQNIILDTFLRLRKNIFKQNYDVNVCFIFFILYFKKECLLKFALKRFFNILMVRCLRKKLWHCILYSLLAVFDTWEILYTSTILKIFASMRNVNWYVFFSPHLDLNDISK